jgi:hypothetical protein
MTTLIDDVLTNVRQIVRKAPNITLRRAYTRAMREWCQQTQWLRMNLSGPTIAGVKVMTLGTDPDLDIMGIRAVSVTDSSLPTPSIFPVAPSDSTQWNPNLPPGRPRRYCYIPEGTIALDPTPDIVYALTISLIISPKESAEPTAVIPDAPLVKYSNDIESGALAYLLSIPGQPWTDMNEAKRHAAAFQASINNGKAEVQRAYNTGSIRARSRWFGSMMGA